MGVHIKTTLNFWIQYHWESLITYCLKFNAWCYLVALIYFSEFRGWSKNVYFWCSCEIVCEGHWPLLFFFSFFLFVCFDLVELQCIKANSAFLVSWFLCPSGLVTCIILYFILVSCCVSGSTILFFNQWKWPRPPVSVGIGLSLFRCFTESTLDGTVLHQYGERGCQLQRWFTETSIDSHILVLFVQISGWEVLA